MWRARRVLRDREAGMVFDWRTGHGSATRLLVAAVISASFWAALLAYVQIRKTESSPLVDQQVNLTVMDLDLESNAWFSSLLERETLFHDRWDVASTAAIEEEISRALEVNPVPVYVPRLREIEPPKPDLAIELLPGMGPQVLPPPEDVPMVEFATPPVKWWVEIESVQGDGEWDGISFEWPNPKDPMSEGEVWTLLAGVDWEGHVLTCSAWEESDDARTPLILNRCRSAAFPALAQPGPLRWWKLQARVVNRPTVE
ncbi:hypothetical protein V2O64_09705 [Verrucomicrobiaceae bacterium 227]